MKYEEMKELLLKASDSYYNKSKSIMTDKEFDELKDEFARLYPNDLFLLQIGSPVSEKSHWGKAKHEIPMGSLNKVNLAEEFYKWAKTIGDNSYMVNDKLDGGSLAVNYKDGKIISAITRGDGVWGENIFRNVIKMKNVKKSIDNYNLPREEKLWTKFGIKGMDSFSGSLRGEIVLEQKDFETINKILESNGEKLMSNPRNAANGIAKRLDGVFSEYLTVIYYDCTGDFSTEEEKFKFLEKNGLRTSYWKVVDVKEVETIFREFEDHKRAESSYCIDGLVVKANNIELQKRLGLLGGNPKAQIAWKFGAMTGKTKVIDIEWQLGNQSSLTPVVIFETINLGANINKASLCNLEMFLDMNLAKGDIILVSRRNDVIPKAEQVIKRFGNEPFEYPKVCPVCGYSTTVKGKFLYCLNDECDGNVIGGFNKFIDKMDMKGLAESTLVKMYDAGLIKSPADLFKVTADDLLKLEGFAERSANKVIAIINSKKEVNLPVFIGSLNIPQFSESMTKLLVEAGYDTLDKILNITKNELVAIRGIEEKTATAFLMGLNKKKILIKELLKVGITIKPKEKVMTQKSGKGKLSGEVVVFTGGINRIDENGKRFTRNMMQDLVYANGGECQESINSKNGVTMLVQADPTSQSAKTRTAKSLGIDIVSEDDFFKKIGM